MAGSIAIKVTSESHCQAPIGLQNDRKAETLQTEIRNTNYYTSCSSSTTK